MLPLPFLPAAAVGRTLAAGWLGQLLEGRAAASSPARQSSCLRLCLEAWLHTHGCPSGRGEGVRREALTAG